MKNIIKSRYLSRREMTKDIAKATGRISSGIESMLSRSKTPEEEIVEIEYEGEIHTLVFLLTPEYYLNLEIERYEG